MPKDQVWKIISFFHTKRQKKYFAGRLDCICVKKRNYDVIQARIQPSCINQAGL